jgi:hypothetical protein
MVNITRSRSHADDHAKLAEAGRCNECAHADAAANAPSRTCPINAITRVASCYACAPGGGGVLLGQRAGLGPSSLLLDCTCLSFGAEVERRLATVPQHHKSNTSTTSSASPSALFLRAGRVLGAGSGLAAALIALPTSARRSSRGRGSGSLARARRAAPCLPNIHPNPNPFRAVRSLARWSLGSKQA